MPNPQEITNYHLSREKNNIYGFEFEIFCLNSKYHRLFFDDNETSKLKKVFNYLIDKENFKAFDSKVTVGVEKKKAKFKLEPGFQLEYSSRLNQNTDDLIEEYIELLKLYRTIGRRFNIKFSDIPVFPYDNSKRKPFLSTDCYDAIDKHFKKTGKLGGVMLRDTTSIQFTYNYQSKEDLEEKVNRLLFLKPVLLILSSNSRIFKGKDTRHHSFHEIVWRNTDPKHCGDPGENFWANGKWILKNYIKKVLDAPIVFDVAKKRYKTMPAHPFRDLMNDVDIESYIFHNSSMFTDIRIKNYIELRYLDNPTILLVPGIALLIESILNQNKTWKVFKENLPYKFSEVPTITQKLNTISEESFDLWNKKLKPTLVLVLNNMRLSCDKRSLFYLDVLKEKTDKVGDYSNLEIDSENVLEKTTDQFNNNVETLIKKK